MLMHFHAYVPLFSFILILILLVLFCVFLSLPLSFISCPMASKRKFTLSQNPLRSGASSSSDTTPTYIRFHDDKTVRTFQRTFLDEAFIRNTKSFYQIFPILTFQLPSLVKVRSHCVASRSPVPPWSYRSFTPTCTDLITLYLIFPLAFEVRAL